MTHVNEWRGVCALCGECVAGRADPKAGATVPAPGPGDEVRCLLCALGLTKAIQANQRNLDRTAGKC